MAKKIIITFNSQPTTGLAVNYSVQADGVNLVYTNGQTSVNFEYQNFLGGDPAKCTISPISLSDTINNTLSFLKKNYSLPEITYQRVSDTIEVLVNIPDKFLVVYLLGSNANIELTSENVSDIVTTKLKYFFQYKNVVDDEYRCEIYKKLYTGAATEISGRVTIEKASVNTLLDPIRGGGVSLQLEATKDLTLEDLYSEDEQDFTVKVFKNNTMVFIGYLHPDGVFQDYVRDEWRINLDCVDGLGMLSNLSFVQDSGLHFTGKMKAMDIIYYCLKRTGFDLPINTSVNTHYDGLLTTEDILNNIYLNADRFTKTDNDTLMSCEDVLKSVLDIFKACITQIDCEWYIYKPNEISIEPYVVFRKFKSGNVANGTKTVNMNKDLGSQIDGFYPHHCTGNQRIEIKGAIGGFRLNYKFGLVSGLLENPKLIKNGGILSYDGWNVNNPFYLINDPLKSSGFYLKNDTTGIGTTITVISDPLSVTIDDDLSLSIDYSVQSTFGSAFIKMQIKHGVYYLKYAPKNSETPIDDTVNATWTTNSSDTFTFYLKDRKGTFNIQLPKILSDSNLTVAIIKTYTTGSGTTTIINSLDIKPTQSSISAIEGEFHTVERKNRVSSLVKENQTVYNGDNPSTIYSGAIFKNDAITPTELWSRKGNVDKYALLQIAAEEELRIATKPTKVFIGDIYGYIPYLSLININHVGKFMPIEWSYDTFTNVTTCKQLELFVDIFTDIEYKYTVDYGNTVKPTIK